MEESHADHVTAMAFCYGFFEGATHYHDAVKGMSGYVELICDPEGTTRTEAVVEFTSYMKANPKHAGELPIDAVFRSLSACWRCPDQ